MERLTVTKAAFRWARANAEQRGEDVVTSPDLLFGMIKAHPTDAEPSSCSTMRGSRMANWTTYLPTGLEAAPTRRTST